VQPRGSWHNVAFALRVARVGKDDAARVASAASGQSKTASSGSSRRRGS
jgi:hypothetical protein